MPVNYEWSSCKKVKALHNTPCFQVSSHPLKTQLVVVKESPNKSFIDQLSKWSSGFVEVDPLLKFEQMNLDEDVLLPEPTDEVTNYQKAWNTRRTAILNKYTTGEKLTIVSSFLPGGEKSDTMNTCKSNAYKKIPIDSVLDSHIKVLLEKMMSTTLFAITLIRQVSNLNEKVKHRLEQLDEFDEGSVRKTMGLSQQEYVSKINVLNDEIKKAWDTEQRVKAFKIGIQCSKLLADVSVMQFYPSKFILITDILDTFGNLVFDRLKEKSFGQKVIRNILDIDSKEVPESAKETCQNWMYKMASIRELLPRLYMEMTLLKCCVFISKDEIKPALLRLTRMIRGIGNPLVASYLRLYLCKVASRLLGKESEEYFYDNLKEFLEEYQQIFHTMMKKKYEVQLLTLDKYLSLYSPAADWMFYGALKSDKCKQTLLEEFLQQCDQMENNELFLCSIVSSFDSTSIIKKSSAILEMIQKDADKMVMLNEVLSALGEHMCAGAGADSYRPVASEALIQAFWKVAGGVRPAAHFLQVLAPWMQFATTHLSAQYVNVILRGTIRYMIKCGKSADEFSGNLLFVIKRMLQSIPDVEEIFLMDAFMPLVELVQTPNARTLMAKTVLTIFFQRYTSAHIDDHIVISSLMRLCCILHDSINAVTVEDEVKACSELIIKYVVAVSHQEQPDQQLAFYVECRASFIRLDAVLVALVHAVNALSARAEGRWLQRACAAYCYITVPSLACALARAHLYLLSGQAALLNNCIGQAEANFKALIGLIPDIPEFILEDGQKKPTHLKVAGILSDFLSTLLVLPDNVDSNCKAYILSGFIKTMERIHWKKTDPLYYSTLLRTLDLLTEMTQENYAHHIDAVLSNDKLYGSEEEFIEIIEKYASNICQELLVVLKALGDAKETKKQYNLALELFWRVIRRGDLTKRSMISLAANLWMLSQKLQDSNNKTAKSILSALRTDKNPVSQQLLQKLEEVS